jgi:hypothetical protein
MEPPTAATLTFKAYRNGGDGGRQGSHGECYAEWWVVFFDKPPKIKLMAHKVAQNGEPEDTFP